MSESGRGGTIFAAALFCAVSLCVGVGLGHQFAPASTHTHSETSLHYDCDGCLPELQAMAQRLNEALTSGKIPPKRATVKGNPTVKVPVEALGPEKPIKEAP